jgi:hypothetical protein
MANDDDSLFGPTVAEVSRLRDELREHVAVRWQLARLELTVAFADLRRLAICLAVAGLLALISLPVAVVAAADALAGQVVAAVATGWLGWRRFQRHFVGLEETLEVLREDQAWVESLAVRSKRSP